MSEKKLERLDTELNVASRVPEKSVLTLGGIHGAELAQTWLQHPELWSSLHTAMSVGLIVSVASWATAQLKRN